jgi:hypothetical protein
MCNVFLNDIFNFVKENKLYNYADNNTLSHSGPDLHGLGYFPSNTCIRPHLSVLYNNTKILYIKNKQMILGEHILFDMLLVCNIWCICKA